MMCDLNEKKESIKFRKTATYMVVVFLIYGTRIRPVIVKEVANLKIYLNYLLVKDVMTCTICMSYLRWMIQPGV